jgi:hypothetical protein
VDLLAYEPFAMIGSADAKGFHDLPPREIRAAYVADLSLLNQGIERRYGLLKGRETVPFVQLKRSITSVFRRLRLASQALIK